MDTLLNDQRREVLMMSSSVLPSPKGSHTPVKAPSECASLRLLLMTVASAVLLAGCSTSWHQEKVQGSAPMNSDRLSVGTVQRSIHNGMSSAEVIAVLGSPNIVSTDDQHQEVWVYDKIATDVSYSNSSSFGTLLLIGANQNAGSQSTNQRTLTIAVKFDGQHKVRDFSYHQTSF